MTNNLIQSVFEQYITNNVLDHPTIDYINDTNYRAIVIEARDVSENWLKHACYHIVQRVNTVEARWRPDPDVDGTYIIELPDRSTVYTVPTVFAPDLFFQ